MKTFSLLILIFISQFIFSQKGEEKLVRNSFENFKNALMDDNGVEAIKYVDTKTLDYYDEILDVIKSADSVEMQSLSIVDKMMVLNARHLITKKEILSFDGESLFIRTMEQESSEKKAYSFITIGKIKFEKDFAKGQMITNGFKTSIYYDFFKESDEWKVDLTSYFPESEKMYETMISQSEKDENEYLLALIEFMSGEKPSSEIWEPIE